MKGKFGLLLVKMMSSQATSDVNTVGGAEFWRALDKGKILVLWEKGKERRGGWFLKLF